MIVSLLQQPVKNEAVVIKLDVIRHKKVKKDRSDQC